MRAVTLQKLVRQTGRCGPRAASSEGLLTEQPCLEIFHRLKMTRYESIAVGLSTPEEQIAHNTELLRSRWQKTPDMEFYMQKAIGKGCVTREHGYWCSNGCDVPVGGTRNTHQDGPCGPHMCQMLDGGVAWASEAPPCLPGAAGGWGAGRGRQPRARPGPSHSGLSRSPWHCPPLQLLPAGGS